MTCNRDGCEAEAVANLLGHDGYQKAARCKDHLVLDLQL
jgi:hypothetical protein